ncbi:5348_t:CDS:2, partial [Funneliformis mosseae]
IPRLQERLMHDGNWKEGGNKLNEVALKILDTLKIVFAIHATLFDNPFGEYVFITT